MNYSVTLTKPNKRYPVKFVLAWDFSTDQELADGYLAVRKLNLDSKFSKAKRIFFLNITRESVIGIIKLRSNHTVNLSNDAEQAFNELREQALNEIKLRNHESSVIEKLKEIGKFTRINVKCYEPKIPWFGHQKFLFLIGIKVRKSFVLSDPGTGKSAVTTHVIDYRVKQGQITKVVLVVPGHLMYNWCETANCELTKHSDLKGMVLEGDKKERLKRIRQFLNDPSITVLATSYSFWSGRSLGNNTNRNDEEYELLMGEHSKVNMFVLDESHKIKSSQALCSKNILKWFPRCKYGLLLSGTPSPNSLYDFFQQSKLVSPEIFGNDFYEFQKKYFKCMDHWGSKWAIKSPRHKEVLLRKAEARAMPFSTADCIDLPMVQDETIVIHNNGNYLNELRSLAPAHIQQLLDEGSKGLGVLSRLLTSCSGFVYNKDALGNTVASEFKTNPKLEALEDTCESIQRSNGRAIIWAIWNFDFTCIRRMLDKQGFSYIHIDRNDDPKARMEKITQYETTPEITFLLTSPRLLAQGVNITSAKYALYYSFDWSYENRVQSMARNCRIGSKELHDKIVYYTFVMKDSIEEDVLAALREKRSYKEAIFGISKNLMKRIRQFRSKR